MERFNAATWLVDRNIDEGRGGNVAVECGDRTLTYADLVDEVHAAAHGLRGLGVRPEERVVLVLNDDVPFLATFLAALHIGAVPVPVSTMLTGKELGVIVDDARARVVYLSEPYAPLLPAIADGAPDLEVAVVDGEAPDGGGVATRRLDEVAADRSESNPTRTVEDSPAFWLYTSGTTGLPKGAMHRHIDLRVTADTYAAAVLHTGPDDRFFSVAKLFFAYGLGNSLTFPLAVGATTILSPERPTPPGVADICARHRPTLFFAAPGFYAGLLDAHVAADTLASVRLAVSAGEALPADLHRRFTTHFGVPLLDGIGTTEALHIFCSNRLGAERPGTSGTAVDGYELKLVGDDGVEIAAPDTPGALYVKGESVATGYWCRTATSRQVFAGDWMRTGDTYTRSADGYYTCLGRSNDMIKPGGIWVSPAEVEAVLVEHSDVLEAAVVGARNDDGLEEPVAFVVARSGAVIDAAAIDAHCRERMAAFKRPRRVIVVDALPRTATGKIQRFALRDRLSAI
ncbi:MAG TPA: benzoate-CoA ligase family protein [Acidimicrobiales bacterium]|nr:benzoate-CoA ligase family protein [Acidimicrobiales bacterium]